jgi:hypothetical protein
LPTDSDAPATARLLDAKGGQLPVTVQVGTQKEGQEPFRWIVADVSMLGLAPAHYVAEVTQSGSSRLAAFTVIP